MNWNVGDIAICIRPGSKLYNREVEITGPLHLASYHGEDIWAYSVDPGFPPEPWYSGWGAEPHHLKPLPPANEVTEWNDCIFQPQELVVVNEQ